MHGLHNAGELQGDLANIDDREQYYLLWTQLAISAQLSQYSASSNSVDSIITGTYIFNSSGFHIYMYVCTYLHAYMHTYSL